MYYTIFDTPVLKTLARWFSMFFLRTTGWRTEGQLPDISKFVLVAAPHTSNWDLPYALFCAFILKAKINWMGKKTLFYTPYCWFFRWLGGMPVDRSQPGNVVSQSVRQFGQQKKLILTIAPAGTRKKVKKWKTGFYHIAKNANVPVVLGFLDYRRKVGGIGPVIYPTGDIDADMKFIRNFYGSVTGKHPEKSMDTAAIRE